LDNAQRSAQLQEAFVEMQRILAKENINPADANHANRGSLHAAGAQRYARPRRMQLLGQRTSSAKSLELLIVRLEQLLEAIANAPSPTTEALNEIMTGHAKEFFDTESFAE